MALSNRVLVFDTTLRDGEQSPGCSMNTQEKVCILHVLEELGVDIIEAGFPSATRGDFESVYAIADAAQKTTITGLCRAIKEDIETTWSAIRLAKRPRIHTFISTSPLHMKHKLNMSSDEVLQIIKESVTIARNLCPDVEWSAEDASRSDIEFLCRAVEMAIKAGATTINLPDTVGYALPDEYGTMFKYVIDNVPNSDKAIFSVHCHNDLGLAVANSLAGIKNGARQIECTINGIGERAGNCALEEIVMALKVREKTLDFTTGINTPVITKASRLLSSTTGLIVQPNKAIVGSNAFAHESGIHQDGMLKHSKTYEIMSPESVGQIKSALVLGKHSGRHAFKTRLHELGYDLRDSSLNDAFERFKELADKKKDIYDDDLIALVSDELGHVIQDCIKMKSLSVSCGTSGIQKAVLSVIVNNEYTTVETTGNGPVDAIFKAIREVAKTDADLQLYHVHAVTGGTDAQAKVTVRLEKNGKTVTGQGVDADTLVASARAYISAINKIMAWTL